jgi:hypothetical protein
MEHNAVNSPRHYLHPSGVEVINITRYESFLRGNILKYVLRAPYKNNELEDLKKAQQYLQWEIERIELLNAKKISDSPTLFDMSEPKPAEEKK